MSPDQLSLRTQLVGSSGHRSYVDVLPDVSCLFKGRFFQRLVKGSLTDQALGLRRC